jgi:hypothetical protein
MDVGPDNQNLHDQWKSGADKQRQNREKQRERQEDSIDLFSKEDVIDKLKQDYDRAGEYKISLVRRYWKTWEKMAYEEDSSKWESIIGERVDKMGDGDNREQALGELKILQEILRRLKKYNNGELG